VGFSVDPDLVHDARRSDAALDALLTEIWPEAYRVAFGVLRDRGLAEDAAQEACASIARGLPTLRASEAFYKWMYQIITRHANLAAKRRGRNSELDSQVEPCVDTSGDDRLDLLDAISALPLSQRCVVVLRYYAGLNSSEIAVALGAPAPTVRFHLMLARRTLRSALAVIDSQAPKLEVYPNAR
jgi:RNA polymerase sigma-70 factor, ECF subfamily